MLEITRFTCENQREYCVTDEKHPRFSYTVESSEKNTEITKAVLTVNGWTLETTGQIALAYAGKKLAPYTVYPVHLTVTDNHGETAEADLTMETGKMDEAWKGQWITDGSYSFTEKGISPVPMTFRKKLELSKAVKQAKIYATAMGIYELELDGTKVGDQYFAPGFTSYKSQLEYQTYNVTEQLKSGSELVAYVGGGWAVGSFVFTRKNRVTADRQALLFELHVDYEDGTSEVIGTDTSWDVAMDGPFKMTDLYDGETYDATVELQKLSWKKAAVETLKIHPDIICDYGSPVKAHEELTPKFIEENNGELIYDFGQNFAGVVKLNIKNASAGQVITVRHAEILNPDGTLNIAFLRSAKATAEYTCKAGDQVYSPRMSYMGFRYISIKGIAKENVEPTALVLYSDLERIGDFECSDARINRLQQNIIWSSKSNLMDIPTDCPQRDERMGWTGDIAVFSPTACYNFDMSRFLDKWLKDVRSEQLSTGGIPNTVPVQGYGFPATMPVMAMDFWGDACVLVPWAEYQARGDIRILEENYDMMKKYVKACRFWAGFGFGKNRYIWHTPSVLHFGDWIAPDVPKMSQWQGRSKWTATASLRNTSYLTAKIAKILGKDDDAKELEALSEKVADAYVSVFTDGNGKLKEEFQTGYVLPIRFNMFDEATQVKAADNLAELVKSNDYKIGTGFPGTPNILFALADNGHVDDAYKMLLNEKCPSWLYEVKSGATTIWERWDGLDENGVCPIGDDGTDMMISYNHYASGAVGAFFYERIAGIRADEPGYKSFTICPVLDSAKSLSNAKGNVNTPYGTIVSDWKINGDQFVIKIQVPAGTTCNLQLPDGSKKTVNSGSYSFGCRV